LLDIYSIAPGIYTVYDYTNALAFHARVLPGTVTITENGTAVMTAQLTSIADIDPANTSLFTPTAQMIRKGPRPRFSCHPDLPFLDRIPLPAPRFSR
jgi:hypothetical protein